jgi:hypothetical protein
LLFELIKVVCIITCSPFTDSNRNYSRGVKQKRGGWGSFYPGPQQACAKLGNQAPKKTRCSCVTYGYPLHLEQRSGGRSVISEQPPRIAKTSRLTLCVSTSSQCPFAYDVANGYVLPCFQQSTQQYC